MNVEDAHEFSESWGQIASGTWRQAAWAHRQGIPELLGMTTQEWIGRYGAWVKLSIEDRREAVLELTSGPDALNNVEAAAVLGVSEKTVRRDREPSANAEEEVPSEHEPSANAEGQIEAFGQLLISDEDKARLALDAALVIDLPPILSVIEQWADYANPDHRQIIERAIAKLRGTLGVQRLERIK